MFLRDVRFVDIPLLRLLVGIWDCWCYESWDCWCYESWDCSEAPVLGDVFYRQSTMKPPTMWGFVLHSHPFTTGRASKFLSHIPHMHRNFWQSEGERFTMLSRTCNFTIVVNGLRHVAVTRCGGRNVRATSGEGWRLKWVEEGKAVSCVSW